MEFSNFRVYGTEHGNVVGRVYTLFGIGKHLYSYFEKS